MSLLRFFIQFGFVLVLFFFPLEEGVALDGASVDDAVKRLVATRRSINQFDARLRVSRNPLQDIDLSIRSVLDQDNWRLDLEWLSFAPDPGAVGNSRRFAIFGDEARIVDSRTLGGEVDFRVVHVEKVVDLRLLGMTPLPLMNLHPQVWDRGFAVQAWLALGSETTSESIVSDKIDYIAYSKFREDGSKVALFLDSDMRYRGCETSFGNRVFRVVIDSFMDVSGIEFPSHLTIANYESSEMILFESIVLESLSFDETPSEVFSFDALGLKVGGRVMRTNNLSAGRLEDIEGVWDGRNIRHVSDPVGSSTLSSSTFSPARLLLLALATACLGLIILLAKRTRVS